MYMQMLRSSAKTFALVTFCACAMMLSACGGATALRNAQDAFNKASAIDTRQLFKERRNIQPNAELDKTLETEKPEIYYRAALDYLESINDFNDKQSLQRDGLWSTKLTLEALCHWKLGHYEEARAIANKGVKLATEIAEPRDKIVLTILPALIKIDQAEAQTVDKKPDEIMLKRLLLDKDYGARKHIDDARRLTDGLADKRLDLEAYVTQVELSMYQVWDRGIGLNSDDVIKVTKLLCDLYMQSQISLTQPEALALATKWKNAFNVPFKHDECP